MVFSNACINPNAAIQRIILELSSIRIMKAAASVGTLTAGYTKLPVAKKEHRGRGWHINDNVWELLLGILLVALPV